MVQELPTSQTAATTGQIFMVLQPKAALHTPIAEIKTSRQKFVNGRTCNGSNIPENHSAKAEIPAQRISRQAPAALLPSHPKISVQLFHDRHRMHKRANITHPDGNVPSKFNFCNRADRVERFRSDLQSDKSAESCRKCCTARLASARYSSASGYCGKLTQSVLCYGQKLVITERVF